MYNEKTVKIYNLYNMTFLLKSKTFVILGITAASLVLGGCINKLSKTSTSKKEETTSQQVNQKLKKVAKLEKKAFGGKTFMCTSKQESGGFGTIMTDGENMRIENTENGKKSYLVRKGSVIYFWSEGKNKGYKMDLGCIIGDDGEKEDNSNFAAPWGENLGVDPKKLYEQAQKQKEFEKEGEKVSCKLTKDKVNTKVPDDINFVDQCELIKSLKDSGLKLPEGVNIPKR